MKKNSSGNALINLTFLGILAGIALPGLLLPKKHISELEKRVLADPPVFSVSSLLSGDFASDMLSYAQDHIAWRDLWIDLYSSLETDVFGRQEVNGILLGKEGRMFTQHFDLTEKELEQFEENLDTIREFARRYPGKVTVMPVPPSEMIYPEDLPDHAPQRDLNPLCEEVQERLGDVCTLVDLRESFKDSKTEPLYYRTDHHWTFEGSYLAYRLFCEANDLEAYPWEEEPREEAKGFLGSHYALSRWNKAQAETISYCETDCTMTVMEVQGENDYLPGEPESLVNQETLKTLDPYGAFLDGNHGFVKIKGKGDGGILVVKDSYANCFIPYLTENYGDIGCLDFREFPYGPDGIISSEGYEDILILYGMDGFLEDSRLVCLNRPGTGL